MLMRQFAKRLEVRLPAGVSRALLGMMPGTRDPYADGSDANQAIFIHVPKTAGMNIAKKLFGRRSSHIPICRYHAFDADRFRDYFKFAFVRNPWDRTHSAYRNLRKFVGRDDCADGLWATAYLSDIPTFATFVRRLRRPVYRNIVSSWTHFRPQYEWLSLPGEQGVACDFVGRFESLHDDFRTIAERLGSDAQLEQRSGRPANAYVSAYDGEMVEIVAKLYERDIETFGYEFGK